MYEWDESWIHFIILPCPHKQAVSPAPFQSYHNENISCKANKHERLKFIHLFSAQYWWAQSVSAMYEKVKFEEEKKRKLNQCQDKQSTASSCPLCRFEDWNEHQVQESYGSWMQNPFPFIFILLANKVYLFLSFVVFAAVACGIMEFRVRWEIRSHGNFRFERL